MKRIFKYTGSLLCIILAISAASAQENQWLPSGLRIGTDIGLAGASLINKDKSLLEINADLDVYKFLITADYGLGSWEFDNTNFSYKNTGHYMKFGIDYNFIFDDPDRHIMHIGLRYAFSNYKENFSYDVIDPIFGNYSEDISSIDLHSGWAEAVLGIKIRIWKELYMGWIGRMKFAKGTSSSGSSFSNYWIPGFGKGKNDSAWGFGYQVSYRIPFRDKPIIQRKEKKIEPAPEQEQEQEN